MERPVSASALEGQLPFAKPSPWMAFRSPHRMRAGRKRPRPMADTQESQEGQGEKLVKHLQQRGRGSCGCARTEEDGTAARKPIFEDPRPEPGEGIGYCRVEAGDWRFEIGDWRLAIQLTISAD
jgi:hypothetical protein